MAVKDSEGIGGMGNAVHCLLSDLVHLVASPKWDKSCQLNKDWTKPCEASRKAPQNTLSLKFWVGQALKQALKQESKIVWICEQCEHHANIMRTWWAVLVLPVVRPIGGYHCRLHPALRRDLPNLAPVHSPQRQTVRRLTERNLDELGWTSPTECDYCVTYCDYCILCYNLITTGTLAPRSAIPNLRCALF